MGFYYFNRERETLMRLIFLLIPIILTSTALAEPWEAGDLNPVTVREAPRHETVTLVADGIAKAVVYVPGQGAPGVAEAIPQLLACIKQSTGVDLPVVETLDDRAAIVVGDCSAAQSAGLSSESLPAEGFTIKTAANRVFIVGDVKTGGLAWGVYEFAERFVGARWYFPGDAGRFTPKTHTLRVPPIHLEDRPVFPMRAIWPATSEPWHGMGTNLQPVQTALRSANVWPHQLQVHTPNWSGIDDYKKNRPEVYQLTEAGTRDWSMLCYSNPRTIETYLENIDKALKHDPSANVGLVGDTITVSPNDAELACHCKDCRAAWDKKAGQNASASKIVANFTSKLATEVQKRWPKMTVLMLAYVNYTDPPAGGVSFPGNVEIQLCGMPGMAMYKEPELLAHEMANVDAWRKLTGRKVQNWHYSCWPEDKTKAVYAYPHVVQNYYRQNRDTIVGTFINGEMDHWPRQHLSLYCWLKVLWNPDFNVDAAIDGYCRNLYGPAEKEACELVKLQMDGWENSRWRGGRLSSKNVYEISYPSATVDRMKTLVQQIRAMTKSDPTLAARAKYFTDPFDAMFEEAKAAISQSGKPLIIQRVGDPPKIDGKLDEPAWQRAEAVPFVRAYDRDHKDCKYPTTVRSVWTDAGVTFAFEMTEPAPAKLQTSRTGRDNSTLWWDDNIELLLDVTGKGEGEYYHFIVTPANVIADARVKDYSWDLEGLKVAAAVEKQSWTLEVFVPFSEFADAAKPAAGRTTKWTGNFTRHRIADAGQPGAAAGSEPEYQRMNTTYAIPSENLSDFVPIEFRE
jgi:hypothetical protein